MTRLSAKREAAIYKSVFDRIMTLRLQLQREHQVSSAVDAKIARAMDEAARAAVAAAKGEQEQA